MKENTEQLTLKAQQAIRTYVLNLLVLPGITLSIASFFLGYFIKDVAESKANFEVGQRTQEQLQGITVKMQEQLQALSGKMTDALVSYSKEASEQRAVTMRAFTEAETAASEVKRIHTSLKILETFSQSGEIVTDLANKLRKDRGFLEAVSKQMGQTQSGTLRLTGQPGKWLEPIRVDFDESFAIAPRVVAALSRIYNPNPDTTLGVEIVSVDAKGFTYHVLTSSQNQMFTCDFVWLAFPQ